MDEVLTRCGPPLFREDLAVESARLYTKKKDVKAEVWIYSGKSIGSASVNFQLIFVGLELVEITPLKPYE